MAFLMIVPIILLLTFVFVFARRSAACSMSASLDCRLKRACFGRVRTAGRAFGPLRWRDNIPLLSYWLLGGRCRHCGATFSIRYFLIELGTALGFLGLFVVEIIFNIHDLPFFSVNHGHILAGRVPWQAWVFFGHHAVLLSLLIVAAACDLDRREIPLGLTFFGAVRGLDRRDLVLVAVAQSIDRPQYGSTGQYPVVGGRSEAAGPRALSVADLGAAAGLDAGRGLDGRLGDGVGRHLRRLVVAPRGADFSSPKVSAGRRWVSATPIS